MRHLPPSTVLYRPLPTSTDLYRPQSRAHTRPNLHAEHVLPGVALQPQQAGVRVPRDGAARQVGSEPAVRALGHTAFRAFGVEAREQQTCFGVPPPPPRAGGRLVAGREENGIWLAARCAVAGGDLGWRVVDLQAHGAAVFGVAPEPGANQRRPRAQ